MRTSGTRGSWPGGSSSAPHCCRTEIEPLRLTPGAERAAEGPPSRRTVPALPASGGVVVGVGPDFPSLGRVVAGVSPDSPSPGRVIGGVGADLASLCDVLEGIRSDLASLRGIVI